GRSGPAAKIDPLDTQSLHHDRLSGRVGAERGDALPLREQLAQAFVKGFCGHACHGVIVVDRAALLDDLAGRVEASDAGETQAVEPLLCFASFAFQRTCLCLLASHYNGHFAPLFCLPLDSYSSAKRRRNSSALKVAPALTPT